MNAASAPFSWPVRVYVEDTDFGGVVFYANYLKYMERARTELLRSTGISQQGMLAEYRVMFVVTSVEIAYRAPARMDDELSVTAQVEKMGRASIRFRQDVCRAGEVLVSALVGIACVNADTMRPQPIPAGMLAKMKIVTN